MPQLATILKRCGKKGNHLVKVYQMRITMFGSGYVGLVTGSCFAEMGNHVICVDVDPEKIRNLSAGKLPIFEPGLQEIVAQNIQANRLSFTTDAKSAIDHADVIFIAVGTPSDEDGSADLKYVLEVASTIGHHMNSTKIIVDKSTVPVGTGDLVHSEVEKVLANRKLSLDFHVASNPEFLKEGAAVSDFMKPDRIVIGTHSNECADVLEDLYAPFNRNHDKVVHMDVRSAELTKYAANVMLAAKISLMNEFANLAETLGADIEAVRRGMGSDPRIGYHFIYPGAGYGGSCFPKDVRALGYAAEEIGYDAKLIRNIESVNNYQKTRLFEKVRKHFGDLSGLTVALWGLAFKPNTDDMREAPSVTLINQLIAAGAKVRAYDPEAANEAERIFRQEDRITICEMRDQTLEGSDALVIITEWNEFRSPDFQLIRERLAHPVIFDGRNLFEPKQMLDQGFTYYAIGRPILS